MSEMIDRVAHALCDFDIGKDAWNYTGEHECRDDYRALARIALKAMREPTEAMIGTRIPGLRSEIIATYHDMIDEALK